MPIGALQAMDTIQINGEIPRPFYSIAEYGYLLEDSNHELSFEDFRSNEDEVLSRFEPLGQSVSDLGFTTSSYWVRFNLRHQSVQTKNYLIEVARPITNVANLYMTDDDGLTVIKQHGDERPFFSRTFDNRKLVFPVTLKANHTYSFLLHLRSDGEVITLPIKLWEKDSFTSFHSRENYFLGIYYGFLVFVVMIYLFFFQMLRERAYLYYSAYVASMFFLQLALDSLSFQLLWPKQVWFANHSVLIFGALANIFLLFFVQKFMRLKKYSPGYHQLYRILIAFGCLMLLMSVAPAPVYPLAFPFVNGLSLLTTFLILFTIFRAYKRKQKVNPFFASAFVILLLSALFFILGNFSIIYHPIYTAYSLKIGSAIEVMLLSLSMVVRYRDIQQEKEQAQKQVLIQVEEKARLTDEINVRLEQEVSARTEELNQRNSELTEKNSEITASITYAKRIQEAILPPLKLVEEQLKNSFVFYEPKDIVAGDFYWLESFTAVEASDSKGNKEEASSIAAITAKEETTASTVTNSDLHAHQEDIVLFAAADCTGHGVPGAMVSVVCSNALNRAVREFALTEPARILDKTLELVIERFEQSEEEVHDGMDIALCAWNPKSRELQYAGAHNPLWIYRKGIQSLETLEVIKADKQPIGRYLESKPFTNHTIQLEEGDAIYIFSDGFADQFGGPKGKKYKYKPFKAFLLSICELEPAAQKEALREEFHRWRGHEEQVDDVCIIGFRG